MLNLDLGLLEIGLVASWIWKEHEENFMLVFNLIFSSCFHLCSSDMGLSSCLLGSWVRVLVRGEFLVCVLVI